MSDAYTIRDLIQPEVREAMEQLRAFDGPNHRTVVQDHLSFDARLMIDGIHLLLCKSDECKYYDEESTVHTWTLPEHETYTDIAVITMNLCGFGPEQWTQLLGKYLDVIRLIGGPGQVHEMVKYLYYNSEDQQS